MTLPTVIKGTSSNEADVSNFNELYIVNRFANESLFNSIVDANAYNFAPPVQGANFILDGVICNADKSVTTSALVDIYEADSIDSTTIQRSILRFDVTRNTTISMTGLNLLINKGFWVNAKADDFNVNLTLIGHRRTIG
jgi:hypothetical protein